jgi:hypothetical protein
LRRWGQCFSLRRFSLPRAFLAGDLVTNVTKSSVDGSAERCQANMGDERSNPDGEGPPTRSLAPSMWRLAGMGVDLSAAVAGFTLIGWWADRHWQTSPRYTVVGVVLGMIGGMYNLIRRALRASRDASGDSPGEHGPDGHGPGGTGR